MKLQHSKSARLTLNNGEIIPVEFIGKGRFSEAWKNCTSVYVITRAREWGTDYAKEMLSHLTDDETFNKHIPMVEYLGDIDGRDDKVYKMPLYEKLTAKYVKAWSQFKLLEAAKEQAWNETMAKVDYRKKFNPYDCVVVNDRTIELLTEQGLDEELLEALQLLRDNITNWGTQFLFEFEKRNLCVDSQGKLILLDCLFDYNCV